MGNDVAMSVRTCIFALAFLLAGAILFGSAGLGAIVFLFARHGGSAFGYYGCDIPTANIQREVDPVARLRADGRRLGLRPQPQAGAPLTRKSAAAIGTRISSFRFSARTSAGLCPLLRGAR